MMLCGIFLLLMLWSCEGARLTGKETIFFFKVTPIIYKIKIQFIVDMNMTFLTLVAHQSLHYYLNCLHIFMCFFFFFLLARFTPRSLPVIYSLWLAVFILMHAVIT